MGVRRLSDIVDALLANGRAADTPAALVENATLPGERVVTGRLDDIVRLSHVADVRAPAVLVVGEVAGLALDRATALCADGGGLPRYEPDVQVGHVHLDVREPSGL